MKKICKIKANRYFQDGYGLFVDIERYGGKIDIRLGTTMNMVEPCISENPIAGREICCEFYGNEHSISDQKCMEAFEKVYWNYTSAYIFFNISDKVGIQPHESAQYNTLATNDFCELEITRYKHKYEGHKFYMDVETGRDPENPDDVWTNVYIMKGARCRKTLCDRYAFEVPKNKYKEILEKNIRKYIKIYRCELADQEYSIPFHGKATD